MGDEDRENDNCPCKRQRLRQGTEASDGDGGCAFSELRSFLVSSQDPELSGTPLSVPEDAGDQVPDCGSHPTEQANDKNQGAINESNMAAKTLNMEINEHFSGNLAPPSDNINNNEGSDTCMNYFSNIKVLSFGEYDLETGQMTEHPVAGKNFHHIKHLMGDSEDTGTSSSVKMDRDRNANSSSQKYRDNQAGQRLTVDCNDRKIHALAENRLIGTVEKSKFTCVETDTRENVRTFSASHNDRERQNISACQLESGENLMEESENRVMPPDYLTDTGFIDMFSNDHVTSDKAYSNSSSLHTQNSNNNNQRKSEKSLFRIKPEYLTQSSVRKLTETHGSILAPCSFSKRKLNELFDIDAAAIKESGDSCAINSLPCSLILEIFKHLTQCCLLRKVSSVCKYWYNLSRDPDLWRTLNLRNQHKLTDEILEQLLKFSERVLHVNLTDCRFISDKGVKAVLSRCCYLQTLKLMRCFDLTDHVFVGVGIRKFCRDLTALHLDGCYKMSDRTILEVAEGCKNLKLLHLNQCNKVTDAGVIALAQNCPRLRQLLLDHCDKVTDAGAKALVQGCPDLVYLNFMSCGVSDIGVKEFAKDTVMILSFWTDRPGKTVQTQIRLLLEEQSDRVHTVCNSLCIIWTDYSKLKNLVNIDLSNIPRLTPCPVKEIARSCPRLESINISLNSVMNDECVAYIARYCQHLKRLYCVSCSITDKGLEEIAKYSPTLEALDVGWCQDITDHGVKVISLACKHLEYLGLIRCDRVTLETVEELVLKYPQRNYSTFILESRRLLERARREGFQCVSEDAVNLG